MNAADGRPPLSSAPSTIEDGWRAPLLDAALRTVAGAAALWFAVMLFSDPDMRTRGESLIFAASFGLAGVGAWRRAWPASVRLLLLLQALSVPVIVALTLTLPTGGTALFLALFILITTLFLGARAGVVAVVGVFLFYLGMGLAWRQGWLPWRAEITVPARATEMLYWLRLAMGQVLGTAALVAVALFVSRHAQRTAQALARSERFLRTIVEDQAEMIVRWRPDGTHTFVNQAYCLSRGRPAEALLGTSFFPWLSAEHRVQLGQRIAGLTPAVPTVTGVDERPRPDGTMVWEEWTERGIFDAAGALVELQSTGRDITAQRRIEEQVRESERRLRAVIEASSDGIWEWEMATDRVTWSDRLLEMMGAAPGGAVPGHLASVDERLHPEDRRRFHAALAAHLEHGTGFDLELRFRRGDGSYGIFHTRGQALRDAAGRPVRVVGSVNDITARRGMEDAVKLNAALLREFVRHTPAAVAMFDQQMCYIQASDRWIADYRLAGQVLAGRSHYEVFPDIPERWKQIHQRVLAGAVERCDEDAFMRTDGRMEWLQWEVRPWRQTGGGIGGLIMFTQVITERKQTALQLAEQLAELQRWNRLTLDRERRLAELKQEVNALCARLAEPARYPSQLPSSSLVSQTGGEGPGAAPSSATARPATDQPALVA